MKYKLYFVGDKEEEKLNENTKFLGKLNIFEGLDEDELR